MSIKIALSSLKTNRISTRLTLRYLSSVPYAGNGIVGIVREQYGIWERRVPLTPTQVTSLTQQGFKVLIQPCKRRIYSDTEFLKAGAVVTDNLDSASLVVGVKQISRKEIKSNRSHMFFSHVIKAQPANMGLLDELLAKNARLFDYECITRNGQSDTPRLVAFGKYAGMAGMIDGFQGLGMRLLSSGYTSPFLNVPMSYMHESLDKVRSNLASLSKKIVINGLPEPVIMAFTGTGNVSIGAREIFELLPHQYVTVDELPTLRDEILSGKRSSHQMYGVIITAKDMVRRKDSLITDTFDKNHYYSNPDEYEGIFHTKVLPYITTLVNGMFWDKKFPRLITNDQMLKLRKSGNKTLKLVCDITCDIGGSVEFFSESTLIDKPFYTYEPELNKNVDKVTDTGILILGVDILPSELPMDASEHFGKALLSLIPSLLTGKGPITDLPNELQRACILSDGKLQPKWTYIQRLREQAALMLNKEISSTAKPDIITKVELRGHLFDTGLINKVFDILEVSGAEFHIANCDVRSNATSVAIPSRLLLQISGDQEVVQSTLDSIKTVISQTPNAATSFESTIIPQVNVQDQKRILLFGSGRVAAPVMNLFNNHSNTHVTIASDDEVQSTELRKMFKDWENRTSYVKYAFPNDNNKLATLLKNSDIAISLLPATMHVPIAEEAIKQKRHLVTASYVSPAMEKLHDAAKKAGVIIMNEVGLDPGIDHMLIKGSIDDIHSRGGIVNELVSLCGGLPDPAAADNPLFYKFSWSPKGVLSAAGNSASYLVDGKVVNVPGDKLLQSATPSNRFPTMRLEVLPNRDSVMYRELYNVPHVKTICRGTLRYEGGTNVMNSFKVLDLMDGTPTDCNNWSELLKLKSLKLINEEVNNDISLKELVKRALNKTGFVKDVPAALVAYEWLGLFNEVPLSLNMKVKTPLDSLASLLESRLTYGEGEKDMVAMYHTVVGKFPDGSTEHHTSRLLDFGVPGVMTSMCSTVGYTTAAAAELILLGKLDSSHAGVRIPLDKDVYVPILKRLKDFGIHWTESITKE